MPPDSRVKLPKIVTHILIMTIGVCGGALVYNNGSPVQFTYTFVLFVSGLFSGLSLYGFVSLLADIKQSKDLKDFTNKIIKNFEIVFYDSDR